MRQRERERNRPTFDRSFSSWCFVFLFSVVIADFLFLLLLSFVVVIVEHGVIVILVHNRRKLGARCIWCTCSSTNGERAERRGEKMGLSWLLA